MSQVQILAVSIFRHVITLNKLFTHIYSGHPFMVSKLAPALAEGQSPFVHLVGL